MSKYIPTVNGYFSGSGGLELGLEQAGLHLQQSLEIDRTCVDTLALNFNHKIVQHDITKVLVEGQPHSDVMAFTYPCTKYSAIADIHGARTGDELFLHALRHVALRLPEVYVIENVPGMLKFKLVMECFTKLPNYYINTFCPLDAANWLPQRRKRLIIIATRKPFAISAPSPQRAARLGDLLERDPKVKITEAVKNRLKGKYRDMPIISDPERGDIAPTCVAHYAKDLSTRLVRVKGVVRPYTPREYARLQGFPDSFKFAGTDNEIYKQVGNAVAVPLGRWIGNQVLNYFNR